MTKTPTPEPMPELLPCPFCGASGTIIEFEGRTISGHYQAQAGCGECSEVFASVGWGRTQNEANESTAAFWNQRADLSRPAGGDADLEKIIDEIQENYRYPASDMCADAVENALRYAADKGYIAAPQPPAEDLPQIVTAHFHQKPMPLTAVLYALAGQEGNDGDEGNAMQAAADYITKKLGA